MALRVAFYEFHYQPVANAFAKAIEAWADVKIADEAESDYKIENEATITPLFSARDDKESNETLQWYTDRLAEAKEVWGLSRR